MMYPTVQYIQMFHSQLYPLFEHTATFLQKLVIKIQKKYDLFSRE